MILRVESNVMFALMTSDRSFVAGVKPHHLWGLYNHDDKMMQ